MDVDKSDYMLFTNISQLQWNDKRINDSQFIYQMNRTKPLCMADPDTESAMWKNVYKTKTPICMLNIKKHCEPIVSCPKPVNNSYTMKDWLMVPCAPPTHKNYIVEDNSKKCSLQHQTFRNVTKRKDITLL